MTGKADLGEGDGVQAVLSGNLETDVVAALGVPGSLGTGLNLGVDLVVVAGSELAEVAKSLESDGVFRRAEARGGGVTGDLALSDVVGGLSTKEETIAANDGVGGQCRALGRKKINVMQGSV